MAGTKKKKNKNKFSTSDLAERIKRKKRRKEVAAIAENTEVPNGRCDAGAQQDQEQVASSPNLRSDSVSPQKRPKKKTRLRVLQECGHNRRLLSEEVSSEKEKKSLLAWVEMYTEPDSNGSGMRDLEGGAENGHFEMGNDAEGLSYERTQSHTLGDSGVRKGGSYAQRLSTEHTRSLSLCDSGERACDKDAFADPCANGVCDRSHEADKSVHVCGKISSFSGHCSLLSKGTCLTHALKTTTDGANPHKRKREDDKVLQYVLKRSIVVKPFTFNSNSSSKTRTTKTVVIAWGRNIPVTLTSEACTVQEWISTQSGNLFGLDVEWRPNRAKGEKNKVALLQLCNEYECLIIQMLFLDRKPQALRKLLSDPSKGLAGVGVLSDGKRLLHDYGLDCQGGIELTTLAVERLKRDELRNAGLKVLVQEVLGLTLDKPKKVTLSNWAKVRLDPAQINYACMDAWASFALSQKLLVDMKVTSG